VYKNSSLINSYSYNLNGTYSNKNASYGYIDAKPWLYDTPILVDEAICHDYTAYDIKVNYSHVVTYVDGAAFSHCGMVFDDTNSKFTNYESIPSTMTGKTSTKFLCPIVLLAKGGTASIPGFSNSQSIPTQYVNFY
jgi:hypothetical protein